MKINLTHIKEGQNELVYQHTNSSLSLSKLSSYDYEIFTQPIEVHLQIYKIHNQYFIDGTIDTNASFICDRCLEMFGKNLHDTFRLIFSVETDDVQNNEDEGDFRVLPKETNEIDITADIRESLFLMIPMKIICSENCNGLCVNCGANLNHEACTCNSEKIDPRWEALKKLKQS